VSDLSAEEQVHVRTALRVLRVRCNSWAPIAKAMGVTPANLRQIVAGRNVSARMAFRLARFVKLGVGELVAGKFAPANTCPHCGKPLPEPA